MDVVSGKKLCRVNFEDFYIYGFMVEFWFKREESMVDKKMIIFNNSKSLLNPRSISEMSLVFVAKRLRLKRNLKKFSHV